MAHGMNLQNPWIDDNLSNVLRNALLLEENIGCSTAPSPAYEAPEPTSLQLISVLKAITEQRKQCNTLKHEIQLRLLDKDTGDLTHLDVLDEKAKVVEELNAYLQLVVERKDELIGRLQRPLVGDHLKLHVSHHRSAIECFTRIAAILTNLSSNLDSLDWVTDEAFSTSTVDGKLQELAGSLAEYHNGLSLLRSVRNGMNQSRAHDSIS